MTLVGTTLSEASADAFWQFDGASCEEEEKKEEAPSQQQSAYSQWRSALIPIEYQLLMQIELSKIWNTN